MRVGLPVAILVGGVAVASLFRRTPPPSAALPHDSREGVVFRQSGPGNRPEDGDPPTMRIESSPPRPTFTVPPGTPTVELRPVEPADSPPMLPKSYPNEEPRPTSRWGVSMGIGLPPAGSSHGAVRVHKIADGDTLPSLARLYYGEAGRASEIFEANRDVLRNPDVLPIGRELKIPGAAVAPGTRAGN